jgi:hypothetical protein
VFLSWGIGATRHVGFEMTGKLGCSVTAGILDAIALQFAARGGRQS